MPLGISDRNSTLVDGDVVDGDCYGILTLSKSQAQLWFQVSFNRVLICVAGLNLNEFQSYTFSPR